MERMAIVSLPSCVRQYDGLFFERADGKDRGFGLVDDGDAEFVAEDSGIGEGKGGSADFIRGQLLRARAAGEVRDGAGEVGEAALFCFAHCGHDQSPLEGDGDAEVDVGVIVNGVVDERRVDDGVVPQGFDRSGCDEGHVSELDAVALFESGALAIA